MEVRFHLPRVPSGLFSNLLGVIGLVFIAVSVGGFLSALNVPGAWFVSMFIAAVEAVWLAAVAMSHADAEAKQWASEPTAKLATVKPRPAAARSA